MNTLSSQQKAKEAQKHAVKSVLFAELKRHIDQAIKSCQDKNPVKTA